MRKLLITSVFGVLCFLGGVATQYLLPVNSSESEIDCVEIPVTQYEPEIAQKSEIEEVTTEEIKNYAEQITVKVVSGQNSGSGILIARQGNIYRVITNAHVLLFGKQTQSYQIQTPDGQSYPAKIVNQYNFQKYDLGVLEFESEAEYEIVMLSSLPFPNIGEAVYAAGFPYKSDTSSNDNFTFTTGKVSLITDLSFRGGYQIGSSNDLEKGMSGGPLFNAQGQIVGINGRHKYPAWGNPYIFEDGTVASPEQKEEMSQSSWAIPIQTFLQFAPEFADKNNQFKITNLN